MLAKVTGAPAPGLLQSPHLESINVVVEDRIGFSSTMNPFFSVYIFHQLGAEAGGGESERHAA